jgi:hypothetical protein
MLALTTWTGALLVATGVIAYVATGAASFTALIPAAVGVLLLIAALIGRRSEKARKHAMHAALAIALLGALGSLMNVVKLGDLFAGTAERPGAIVASTVMFVLLVGYLVAGVRSFVRARAAR